MPRESTGRPPEASCWATTSATSPSVSDEPWEYTSSTAPPKSSPPLGAWPLELVYLVLMAKYGEPPSEVTKSVRMVCALLPTQFPYQMKYTLEVAGITCPWWYEILDRARLLTL